MGVFGGILDAMNLRDDDYDEDDYEEEEMDDEPRRFRRKERETSSQEKKASNITPIRSRQSSSKHASYSAPDEMAVVVIKPTAYNDIQEIADTLLSGRTVVLNTEGLDRYLLCHRGCLPEDLELHFYHHTEGSRDFRRCGSDGR